MNMQNAYRLRVPILWLCLSALIAGGLVGGASTHWLLGDRGGAAATAAIVVAGAVLLLFVTVLFQYLVQDLKALTSALLSLQATHHLPAPAFSRITEIDELSSVAGHLGRIFVGKQAYAEALRENEDHLLAILDFTPVALAIVRRSDHAVLFANARFDHLVAGIPERLDAAMIKYFFADPNQCQELFDQLDNGKAVRDVEVQWSGADGSPMWLLISMMPTRFADAPAFFIWLYEITEHRKAAEKDRLQNSIVALLHETANGANQADSVEAALQNCIQAVCRCGNWPVGHVYVMDPARPDRLVSSDLWALADPPRYAAWRKLSDQFDFNFGAGLPGRVAALHRPLWISDLTNTSWFLRTRAASQTGFRTGVAMPVESAGRIMAVLEFFSHDRREPQPLEIEAMAQVGQQLGRVYDRAAAQAELAAARELAVQASHAKSDFLAEMSHELRTPLNAIIGFSEAIKGQYLGPLDNAKYVEYLVGINDAGRHLLELINDILDLSKIEAGKLSVVREAVDLRPVAESALRLMGPRAETAGVRLAVDIEPNLPILQADELRLKQSLLNLLSNAVKFTPSGGTVSFVARRSEHEGVIVTVADTGVGMAEDELVHALQPFEQTASGRAHKGEGTGLGLPLTKRLIELQGGSLELRSVIGQGTTVLLRFPGAATDCARQ